ncbi:MAG: polysaccharide pyruvyl transferase family protein [Brachybacterium sp.]|uniref:polysaccharide pyruvyl transferase family protein n=1 Tax=Brachybacterium sp. TaxID=1891286 RepID=UPI002649B9E6|nr:polysaccharide pyruvyl transferase family protein [Brachybacterium sp.]MDN5687604.1 polysaccharide pyruvyl transferase family protein [Brachybacterium sp.]
MSAPIKTFWWRWKYPHRLNFGDELTPPLVERLTGRRVQWAAPDRCDLVGAGSVVQMILRRRKSNQPLVWGSGFIRDAGEGEEPARLDVLAVRGRSTLGRVENLSPREIALGDPGILAPLLVDGPVTKRYSLGVIPHYHDVTSPVVEQMRALGSGVRVIDVAWTPQEVAQEIAACDAVISSSLHGLIFSDALGVPNAHIRLGDRLKGGLYKFHDYYSAYSAAGRYREYTVPGGGPQSLRAVVDPVIDGYAEPVGLRDLQEGLTTALRKLF